MTRSFLACINMPSQWLTDWALLCAPNFYYVRRFAAPLKNNYHVHTLVLHADRFMQQLTSEQCFLRATKNHIAQHRKAYNTPPSQTGAKSRFIPDMRKKETLQHNKVNITATPKDGKKGRFTTVVKEKRRLGRV